jgi:hypothetical protein
LHTFPYAASVRNVLFGAFAGQMGRALASWHPAGLEALILVAPSPHVPIAVPQEQRKQMIEAYGTRQTVELLIEHVLKAVPIPEKLREMIIEDTLRGATFEQQLIPRIRDAQMKVIPRSGHLLLLEVPDEIAAGIRNFLASFQV